MTDTKKLIEERTKRFKVEAKLEIKELLLKSLEETYKSLFDYFNNKFPDEMTKYLR